MKHTYISFLLLVLLSGITACSEDELIRKNVFAGQDINILAFRPQDTPATKADIKENFKENDIIHVSMACQKGSDTTYKYACLKYDGTKWGATDKTTLTWPEGCESANFTAYYYPSTNALTAGGKYEHPLSILDNENNPLKATVSNVTAGGAVYLQFEHLCTKLTLTKLQVNSQNITDGKELWLTQPDLKNGCSLIRNTDGTLSFEFVQLTNSNDTISNKQVKDGGTCFFLAPGNYEHIKLNYRYNKPFLSFNIPQLNELNAGKHYTLDITNLPGNMVSGSLKEEEYWNNSDKNEWVTIQDINKFLYAIAHNEKYIEGGITILEPTTDKTEGTVIMLKHVDFGGEDFEPVDLAASVSFNANFRTIRNVKLRNKNDYATIFKKVAGSIENLALENLTGEGLNSKYIGGLAGEVIGTISNIKLKGVNTIKILTPTDDLYIGAIIGQITGTGNSLNKIDVSGSLTIEVEGKAAGDIYIGAIAGNSTSAIKNSSINGDVTLINKCNNKGGTFYMGGIAGNIETELSDCTTNALVDASGSTANILYTGGLAGRAKDKLVNCDASGEVKGGTAVSNGDDAPAENHIGGCIGEYLGSTIADNMINNCYALGDVTVNNAEGVTIGGSVGHIKISNANSAQILNSASFGKVSSGGGNYGGFIGKTEKEASGTIIINNSFSINSGTATSFIGGDTSNYTVNNCHNNGSYNSGQITADNLNKGTESNADWLKWTSSTNLFGGFPYLIRK